MSIGRNLIDLFAGPGGWDVAAERLGLDVIGIEWDKNAVATRLAAGLATVHGDVREYGPADFPGRDVLIASPPCQTFSTAGGGAGRRALDLVVSSLDAMVLEGVRHVEFDDERTALVLEPMRWILDAIGQGTPYRTIMLEQVPTVQPVWDAYARHLERLGYSVATSRLNAEQYGVPQTRKRSILIARADAPASLPSPTHSRYHSRNRSSLDEGVLPWVSMAEALGRGMTERPSMTVTGGGAATGGAEPSGNGARKGMRAEIDAGRWDQGFIYVGSNMPNAAVRHGDEPAPTIVFGHHAAAARIVYRNGNQANAARRDIDSPAPTVHFGSRSNKVDWESSGDVVRVSVAEAAALQSFPASHPWQGSKTSQYRQIGNAVPPLLAEAVIRAALDLPPVSFGIDS